MNRPTKIAVVGMGATGTALAIQLVRRFGSTVTIRCFERRGTVGAGLAYGTPKDFHVLNIPSRGMSVFAENPADFDEWLRARGERTGYVPRRLFAEYLRERLVAAGGNVSVIAAEVTDCQETESAVRLTFEGGVEEFDYVVLCPGHLPRRRERYDVGAPERYFRSPWDLDRFRAIAAHARVGILGTSLTAVDTLLTLQDAGFRGTVTCFSRRRQLPKLQSQAPAIRLKHLTREKLGEKLTLAEVLALLRQDFLELEGGASLWRGMFGRRQEDPAETLRAALAAVERGEYTWHSVLDATTGVIGEVWNRLADRDKEIFLARHESLWAMFRHSMPAENARRILAIAGEGRLSVATGLRQVELRDGAFVLRAGEKEHRVDYLIDATGSELDPTNLVSPLVENMLRRQQLTAHPNGGIAVDFGTSRLLFGDGRRSRRISLVGNLTKGVHFYTNSFQMNRDRGREAVDCIALDRRVVHRARTPDGRWLEIRTVDIDLDLEQIWKWWTAPHVQGRWSVEFRLGPGPHTREQLRRYLANVREVVPYIGRIDGVDVGYLETYRVGDSPLASHAELSAEDCGFHTLIGELAYLRTGLGNYVGPLLIEWLLRSHPAARRVVVEPNARNALAINTAIKALGGRRVADVVLPHKTAALIIVERRT